MNSKTARQSGWNLHGTGAVAKGDAYLSEFVTTWDDTGNFCEFAFDTDKGVIVPGKVNSVDLFDLPVSVINLIALWLGAIS